MKSWKAGLAINGKSYLKSQELSFTGGRVLTDRYYVSQPSVTVIGKPSAALAAKIESDEKSRLAARKAELGEEKLQDLLQLLEDAKAESDRPPPADMINSFPLTNVSGFRSL